MNVVDPKVYILKKGDADQEAELKMIEFVGRTCYKSNSKITETSFVDFVRRLIERKHMAMTEFGSLQFMLRVDRGVTHELVRHRLASFAQESTRYCNYGKEGDVTFIRPFWIDLWPDGPWYTGMKEAELNYLKALERGETPQQARSLLPNSTKALICMNMNFRELHHFFGLRCDKPAHPQMRQVAIPLLRYCKDHFSPMFDDLPDFDLNEVQYQAAGLKEEHLAAVEEIDIMNPLTPEVAADLGIF